jgi:hypothetical protein
VTQEGYRHHAELQLHGNDLDLLAKAENADPRAALDIVLDKQERLLSRRKGRMKDRKKRGPTLRLEPAPETLGLPRAKAEEINVVRLRPDRPVLSVDEAARTLISSKKPVLVFSERGGEGLRVAYRLGSGRVGLLELD